MARARVELDHAGMRDLLRSSDVQAEMHRRAERVAETARSIAPVVTGNYKSSIKVVDDPSPTRARAVVTATAPHAHLVEAKSRVLGRALDAAGG